MLNPALLKNLGKGQESSEGIKESDRVETEIIMEKKGVVLTTGPLGEEETVETEYTVKVPEGMANKFAGLSDVPLGAVEIPQKAPVNTEALKAAGLGNGPSAPLVMEVVEGTLKFVPSLGKHAAPVVPAVALSADTLSQEGLKKVAHAPTSIALGDFSARLKKA